MKSFLFKFSLFIALLIISFTTLDLIISFHKSPRQQWQKKFNLINLQRANEFSTFFIGASTVNSHINPLIFDSITGSRSLNLGLNGLSYSQKITFTKALIDEGYIKRGDQIILESIINLSPEDFNSKKRNVTNPPMYYLYTTSNFYSDLKLNLNLSISIKEKARRVFSLLKYYLDSRDKFYRLSFFPVSKKYSPQCHKKNRAISVGFQPYCLQTAPDWPKDTVKAKEIIGNLESELQNKMKHVNNQDIKAFQSTYLTFYEYCAAKNIRLYFLNSPTHGYDQSETIYTPYLTRDYPNFTIDMRNKEKFPALFKISNFYNRGHYNSKGAKIYTEHLAHQYLKQTSTSH